MTRYYFDEDTTIDDTSGPTEGPEDPYTAIGFYDDDTQSHEDYWTNRDYTQEASDTPEPTQWNTLQIGMTQLLVSNTGYLRRVSDPFWCLTKGVPLTGTPYTYVMLEIEPHTTSMFFVHELVWRAFYGDVPRGWEVRHKPHVPLEYTREYPNELSLLDIYLSYA